MVCGRGRGLCCSTVTAVTAVTAVLLDGVPQHSGAEAITGGHVSRDPLRVQCVCSACALIVRCVCATCALRARYVCVRSVLLQEVRELVASAKEELVAAAREEMDNLKRAAVAEQAAALEAAAMRAARTAEGADCVGCEGSPIVNGRSRRAGAALGSAPAAGRSPPPSAPPTTSRAPRPSRLRRAFEKKVCEEISHSKTASILFHQDLVHSFSINLKEHEMLVSSSSLQMPSTDIVFAQKYDITKH